MTSAALTPARWSVRPSAGLARVIGVAGTSVLARAAALSVLAFEAHRRREALGSVLARFDGAYYHQIASHGYPSSLPVTGGQVDQSDVGFFPLFPLIVRILFTGAHFVGGAIVVNLLASTVATVLVYGVARLSLSERASYVAALAWTLWPIAFVLNLAYAEALFCLLAAGCLLMLGQGRYVWGGVFAALATATRPNGLVLVLCCLVALGLAWRDGRPLSRPIIGVAISPLGILAYFGYLWVHTGRWDAWSLTETEGWRVQVDGGLDNLRRVGRYAQDGRLDGLAVVVLILFGLLLLGLLYRDHAHPLLLVYSTGIVVLALTARNDLSSVPRFMFAAFPLLFPLGRRLSRARPIVISLWLGLSAASTVIAGVFLTLHSHYPP